MLYPQHHSIYPPFKISGEGVEQVIFNPQDRVFNFIGEAEEKRTYQYDQSDDIDLVLMIGDSLQSQFLEVKIMV